mmetsp:Transcript_1064/g.2949  ORF Transcript_1064/g.2949 Transcript_1064/m.2949 type:complete len:390 (+) Transcript_1064:469-1638(+)
MPNSPNEHHAAHGVLPMPSTRFGSPRPSRSRSQQPSKPTALAHPVGHSRTNASASLVHQQRQQHPSHVENRRRRCCCQGRDVRRGETAEVDQCRNLAKRVDLVRRAPEAAVNGLGGEELERVVNLVLLAVLGILGTVGVEDVVHEHRRHHRVRRLLFEDLILEVGHAAIGPRESLVVDDGQRRRRGRHHRRHRRARFELHHRAPVLHALRERVVGPLRDGEAVDELDLLATLGVDGLLEVLDEELAARKHVGKLLEAERAKARAVVGTRGRIGRVGADVDVGRRTQEGDARRRARLAQARDAVVGAEGELDVELAVEVRVVADHHLGRRRQRLLPLLEPVGDLSWLLHQVAAGALIHVFLGGALRLRLGEGEDEGARRGLGRLAQPLPQ